MNWRPPLRGCHAPTRPRHSGWPDASFPAWPPWTPRPGSAVTEGATADLEDNLPSRDCPVTAVVASGPGGDRLPLASRIADPRNLTSGRALLGPDHDPAYAGGGGNRSDGTLLVRRHSKPWIPAVTRRPHRRGRAGGPVSP